MNLSEFFESPLITIHDVVIARAADTNVKRRGRQVGQSPLRPRLFTTRPFGRLWYWLGAGLVVARQGVDQLLDELLLGLHNLVGEFEELI